MADPPDNPIPDLVNQARERLGQEFRTEAVRLEQLNQSLQELRSQHQQLEAAVRKHLEVLGKVELPVPPPPPPPDPSLERVLAGVRGLMTATLPEQVLELLTEEGEKLGVRSAVFDVRGKAAWGSSARGFGGGLSEKTFRGLVIPLSKDSPFRTCFETGSDIKASVDLLKKNRNLLDKFHPGSDDPILLLPIRSAGSVSAIFYADGGGKRKGLPVDALKILAEFAGAQLDRLMAFSGSGSEPEEETPATELVEPRASEHVETPTVVPIEAPPAKPAEAQAVEPAETPVVEQPKALAAEPVEGMRGPAEATPAGAAKSEPTAEEPPRETSVEPAQAAASSTAVAVEAPLTPAMGETVPGAEAAQPPPPVSAYEEAAETPFTASAEAPAPPVAAGELEIAQLSEADQKGHRDAKRFAKLLVSEIELYNKPKVAEGRKNADLYKRLKSDIDRSRQTYEKRFGKTVGKQRDYFHEELVKTLAGDDSSLLGREYPGPSA